MTVHRRLRFALLITLALSAIALWPRKPPPLVGAAEPPARHVDAPRQAAAQTLPRSIETWPLDITAARGDPFSLPAPAARQPQAVATPAPAATAAPAPPPAAPAVQYRYFGRMNAPDGQLTTLLARGDTVVAVSEGMTLDDGYVVQAVLADAVRLAYPTLGLVVDIPVPPAPSLPR